MIDIFTNEVCCSDTLVVILCDWCNTGAGLSENLKYLGADVCSVPGQFHYETTTNSKKIEP